MHLLHRGTTAAESARRRIIETSGTHDHDPVIANDDIAISIISSGSISAIEITRPLLPLLLAVAAITDDDDIAIVTQRVRGSRRKGVRGREQQPLGARVTSSQHSARVTSSQHIGGGSRSSSGGSINIINISCGNHNSNISTCD